MMSGENRLLSLGGILSAMPLVVIALTIVGTGLLCGLTIIPQWKDYESLQSELNTSHQTIDGHLTQVSQDQEDDLSLARTQLEAAQHDQDEAARFFWTDIQADAILDRVYQYANESNVLLTVLQAQDPPQQSSSRNRDATPSGLYSVRTMELQVTGGLVQLMNFISRFRENVVPSVIINGVQLEQREDQGALRMTLSIYTSPFASGDVFELLPDWNTPTPIPPTWTPSPTGTMRPTSIPQQPTAYPSATPTLDACVGAPPSLFQVGDEAVVDFNDNSSLRVLTRPRTTNDVIGVIVQAYDNEHIPIVAGPVCGTWDGLRLWYWNVIVRGHSGWVGEAIPGTRWLCPVDDPECA
jgi:hypothetical protein